MVGGAGGGDVVLDGGAGGVELGGDGGEGDGVVGGWEVVALVADGAQPDLGVVVDDAKGVEDGSAGAASERGVGEELEGGDRVERGVDGGDGDDAVRRLLLGAGDHVPRHPHAVLGLELREVRHGRLLPVGTIGDAGEGGGGDGEVSGYGGILWGVESFLRLVELFFSKNVISKMIS